MRVRLSSRRWPVAALTCALFCTAAVAVAGPLALQVRQGRFFNAFLRQGPVAADLVLRSGPDPRLLVAFPAGDSGVGIWFDPEPRWARWRLLGPLRPVRTHDRHGRPLYGICALLELTGDPALQVHQAVLSSIRVLRDYGSLGRLPPGIATPARVSAHRIAWARERLDGGATYRLTLQVLRGRLEGTRILADRHGVIRVRLTGLTGEPPLTPLAGRQLLRHPHAGSTAARDTLTFLAYRQKFLAGSWRFDTYFGRDTLMSVRLLMPALTTEAIDDALDSVLERLSAHGQVAHEEDIGEEAVLENLKRGVRSAKPSYTYLMIDEDYMLAPDAAAWLLNPRERAQAASFLAAPVGGPEERHGTHGAALVRNLKFVLASAAPFARDPVRSHLIGLKPGVPVGDWRDSNTGLGGGYYPYDVNAALVPAALDAIARLYASGLLNPYLTAAARPQFAQAARMARVWSERASQLFTVTVAHATAVRDVKDYAAADGVPARAALASLGRGPVSFPALSLQRSGEPVPVMQSDVGYVLLFGKPTPRALQRLVAAVMRPFPAGLITGAGLVVANPVFAPHALAAEFTRNAYHGTVVWSWQQALLAAGLARQLRRTDLPPAVRAQLQNAQRTLWRVIHATHAMANSELWSWTYSGGHYHIRPFGSASADASEADAAQLWSTVYLAVRPPADLMRSGSRVAAGTH
ncbi:MAG: hypothetical protein ACP5P4_02665 [Steroidobacteraceae bacterium]